MLKVRCRSSEIRPKTCLHEELHEDWGVQFDFLFSFSFSYYTENNGPFELISVFYIEYISKLILSFTVWMLRCPRTVCGEDPFLIKLSGNFVSDQLTIIKRFISRHSTTFY